MSEGMPTATSAESSDGTVTDPGTTVDASDAAALPGDMAAMLAQLRETIGNLDALLASVNDDDEPAAT